jgi:hypothetical protein
MPLSKLVRRERQSPTATSSRMREPEHGDGCRKGPQPHLHRDYLVQGVKSCAEDIPLRIAFGGKR